MQDSEFCKQEDAFNSLFMMQDKAHDPTVIPLESYGTPLDMEFDTGMSLTLINKASYDEITGNAPATLEHTDVQL